MIGTLTGRFLIPLMEPHEIHHVALRADPVLDTCTLHLEHTTTVLGRLMSLGDEIDTLGCSEIRDFPDTWLHCRCSYRDDGADGGE